MSQYKMVGTSTLLEQERRISAMINDERPLKETLEELCRAIEGQVGEGEEPMFCSVLLLDEAGEHLLHGAGPSLPDGYNDAIHGISIGDGVGSCGTAAFTGKPCFVADITTHPNWAAYKGLAYDTYGLAACWSVPIKSPDGRVVATFAVYHKVPKFPTLKERKLIDLATHIVAAAVNRANNLKAIAS